MVTAKKIEDTYHGWCGAFIFGSFTRHPDNAAEPGKTDTNRLPAKILNHEVVIRSKFLFGKQKSGFDENGSLINHYRGQKQTQDQQKPLIFHLRPPFWFLKNALLFLTFCWIVKKHNLR